MEINTKQNIGSAELERTQQVFSAVCAERQKAAEMMLKSDNAYSDAQRERLETIAGVSPTLPKIPA